MDGIRDTGGITGFGRVAHSATEPVFPYAWERRAVRVMMATVSSLGVSGGRFRHSIERMDPAHHLSSSYYEHWLTGIATLLVKAGLATAAELDARSGGRFPLSNPDRGHPPTEDGRDRTAARFAVGDRVLVRAWHPLGHTRAPRYVQGKRGVIVRQDGPANIPDFEAHSEARVLDHTYSVRFDSTELWGEAGDAHGIVHVDLWELSGGDQ